MTTVGAVMSTRLISVCPDDSTLDAINRMVEENVGSVAATTTTPTRPHRNCCGAGSQAPLRGPSHRHWAPAIASR